MDRRKYSKPELTKYPELKSVTFSTHEITDTKILDDYYAEYTITHTDDQGNVTTTKKVGLI